MKRLFDFVYGNFMTLFNKVVANLIELSPLMLIALALVAVALIFVAVMLLIYIIRISKYRTVRKIENVDVVFFNSVFEFTPYKKGKQGEVLFIILIPATFIINFVIKAYMFKAFSAINSSDYITRRMLENMQLENMRMKEKNKDLLKIIDEAGMNKAIRKQKRPTPMPKKQEPVKEVAPKKEEPKEVVAEVETKAKAPEKETPKKEAKAPEKETPKKEAKAPEKATPKKEAKAPEKATPKKEAKVSEDEEVVTTSTILADNDKEPEVIMASNNIVEPELPEKEILEAEVIDPDNENFDELIEDVATKETRGKA